MTLCSRVEALLKDEIPRVKDCSCEIVDRYLLRVLLVCNTVKDESKIAGRHRFVKKILDDAGLAKELDQYVIQIVAWTRMESRRRSKIHAELQPGYMPTRKPKSSSCCKPKSSCSRKPKSSSSQKIPSKPLGDNNGKSKEEEFVVGDDSGNESSEWNSDEESVFEEEPEDNTESDDEFDRMLESDGESDYDDINIDSDDEDGNDDEGSVRDCMCGKKHDDVDAPFEIQCDSCDAWHCVAEGCVGFNADTATKMDEWFCWTCASHSNR